MPAPVLLVEDLFLHYETERGPVRAVDGISLTIDEPGQVLALIGESGSGKTSLARALMRLLPPNVDRYEGRILLNGTDLMTMGNDRFRRTVLWRKISMVFQGAMNSLNPVLRVGRQVAEPLTRADMSAKQAQREADRLLELVGLPSGVSASFPHELSGGMKQRVVIAMALVHQPPMLLLDEPTSALDASVQAQIMNLLKQLKWDLGISMLFITHDIALSADLSDRIAVIHAGEIREQGTADEVLANPLDPYTQGLLAAVPRLHAEERPVFLPGAPPDLVEPPSGCRFHPRCEYAFEPCSFEPPSLIEARPDHVARCWLYGPSPPADAPLGRIRVRVAPVPGSKSSEREPEPLVEVEDLRIHFDRRRGLLRTETVHAVDGLSLSLGRGEVVALVGESGSGKTTLGRATLGLIPPTEGRITFDGAAISDFDKLELKEFRRRAQAIFQDPYAAISPFMSVFESVEEPLLIHGLGDRSEREQRVLEALEQVRLEPVSRFAHQYPHTMSGGQRQRVGIARALVLDPEYVVADEPVSMIDASSRAEILDLLRELGAKRDITFLYITHDIATARHFSDRIAVMYAGRIVETGPSSTVVDTPLHPYTQALLAAVPEPDPDNRLRLREVVPGEAPDPTAIPGGCPFHPRCPEAMAGTCEVVFPEMTEPAPQRLVACHLYPPDSD
ncbi:MAG: ABC transporter ATP-binding protein [Acidobacteria bacterium]|nr:ABC transporter ATP-binding protein [Acidobacteriota bacterium]